MFGGGVPPRCPLVPGFFVQGLRLTTLWNTSDTSGRQHSPFRGGGLRPRCGRGVGGVRSTYRDTYTQIQLTRAVINHSWLYTHTWLSIRIGIQSSPVQGFWAIYLYLTSHPDTGIPLSRLSIYKSKVRLEEAPCILTLPLRCTNLECCDAMTRF